VAKEAGAKHSRCTVPRTEKKTKKQKISPSRERYRLIQCYSWNVIKTCKLPNLRN